MSSDVTNDRDDEPETYHTAGAKLGTSRLSRRGFLRAATAGGTVAAVGGASLSSDRLGAVGNTQAITPGAIAGISRLGAWLGDKVADGFNIGNDDEVSDTIGSNQLWGNIEDNFRRLEVQNEQTLSALENTVEFSERVAIAEGSKAAYEVMEQDGTLDESREARENTIDEYFSDVLEDILTAWHNAATAVQLDADKIRDFEPVDDDEEISLYHIFGTTLIDNDSDGVYEVDDYSVVSTFESNTSTDTELRTEELFDGREVDYLSSHSSSDDGRYANPTSYSAFDSSSDLVGVVLMPLEYRCNEGCEIGHESRNQPDEIADEYGIEELVRPLRTDRFARLIRDLEEAYDNVMDDMYGFEENVYDAHDGDPSDIDTSDAMTPIDTYEAASEETEHAWRDAALRSLGLDQTPDDMDIELHDRGEDGIVVEGSIYALNAELSLETGVRYEPEDFAETSLYISYWDENEDGESVAIEDELNEPFTVLEATDEDGNELDEVDFEDGPDYDPSDTEAMMKALEEQNEILIEMQEEAQQENDGLFAGGISWPSNPLAGLADGAAAVVAGAIAIIFAGIALGGGD